MQQKIFHVADEETNIIFGEKLSDLINNPLLLKDINALGYSVIQIFRFASNHAIAICNFNSSDVKLGVNGL